jgi:hypothetical protein
LGYKTVVSQKNEPVFQKNEPGSVGGIINLRKKVPFVGSFF